MLDTLILRVIGDKIIILVIPHQSPWADLIFFAVVPKLHFLFDVPLVIMESNLLIRIDRIMQNVHVIVD